jgi:hypothetical protein
MTTKRNEPRMNTEQTEREINFARENRRMCRTESEEGSEPRMNADEHGFKELERGIHSARTSDGRSGMNFNATAIFYVPAGTAEISLGSRSGSDEHPGYRCEKNPHPEGVPETSHALRIPTPSATPPGPNSVFRGYPGFHPHGGLHPALISTIPAGIKRPNVEIDFLKPHRTAHLDSKLPKLAAIEPASKSR